MKVLCKVFFIESGLTDILGKSARVVSFTLELMRVHKVKPSAVRLGLVQICEIRTVYGGSETIIAELFHDPDRSEFADQDSLL